MKKDSYDFPAKHAYRESLREFILKKFPNLAARRDLRVACFPGHEGLEVSEVYIPLGIRPTRIYGIEENKSVVQEIDSLNMGIQVIPEKAIDFFKKESVKFDIINLDFQSQFGMDEIETLCAINHNSRLKNRAILGTNFYGSRENESQQTEYRKILDYHREGGNTVRIARGTSEHHTIMALENNDELNNNLLPQGHDDLRNKSISLKLRYGLSSNTAKETLSDILYDPLLPDYLKVIDPKSIPALENIISSPEKHLGDILFLASVKDVIVMKVLSEAFKGNEKAVAEFHAFWEILQLKRPYFITDYIKGRYVSDNGSPMFFDFLYVENFKDITSKFKSKFENTSEGKLRLTLAEKTDYERAPNKVRPLTNHESELFNKFQGDIDKVYDHGGLFLCGTGTHFWENYNKIMEASIYEIIYALNPREMLRVPDKNELIREALKQRVPEETIRERFSLNINELAGHKAYLSRICELPQDPKPSFTKEKSILSEADEQKLMNMIEQNVPDHEIVSSVPLTKMQLAARKAQVTRKNNQTQVADALQDIMQTSNYGISNPIDRSSDVEMLSAALTFSVPGIADEQSITKRVGYFIDDLVYHPHHTLNSDEVKILSHSLQGFNFAKKLRNRELHDAHLIYTFFDDVTKKIYLSKQEGRMQIPSKQELESLFSSVVAEMQGGKNE